MGAFFHFTSYALSLVLLLLAMISTHCGAPPSPHPEQSDRKAVRVINFTGRPVSVIQLTPNASMTNYMIGAGVEKDVRLSAKGQNRHEYLNIVWTTRFGVLHDILFEAFNDTLAAEKCILGEHGNTCHWYLYSTGIYLGKKSQGWFGSSTLEWMHAWAYTY